MTAVWLTLLVVSAAALGYVLVGYPLLLRLIVLARGPRLVRRRDITPPLSLVISAHNEAPVIAGKLENALALDYPRDLLEIVVISDASDDGTDAIVEGYASRGVTLCRQPQRLGKTAGLNAVVPTLRGDVVVFSDANAMYEPDAVRMLVRNFADPQVGCVTGEARYAGGSHGAADQGEGAYWNYEMFVKRLETDVGSCVGGDGAIYAIRRELWQTLPDDSINDFLNPLQIVAAGWRGVYEPDAVCYEEAAGDTGKEYRRRVRIISRSWRAVFQARDVLNPWKVGIFSLCIVSHKILRWWAALFASGVVLALAGLLWPVVLTIPTRIAMAAAAALVLVLLLPGPRRLLAVVWYFVVLNAASVVGLYRGTTGRVSGVWSTPRQSSTPSESGRILDGWTLSALVGTIVLFVWLGSELDTHRAVARNVFWTSLGLLLYLFVGYPILLALLRVVRKQPVAKETTSTPTVCIVVAAHNEEDVIHLKVQNSLALDYPPDRLSVFVASDGSSDGTNAILATLECDRVRAFTYPERRGKIAALSATVPHIEADILVFSDANAFLQPAALSALVGSFADSRVGAVSGDVVLTGERAALAAAEDLYYRYERWLQRVESEVGSMVGVDGALYAMRRNLFQAPPADTVLDDMALPMRVIQRGYRVVFEGAATAHEHGSRSAWEEFARKTRIVAGAVQFLGRSNRQIPWRAPQVLFSLFSHKVLRWLSPLIGGVFLVSCYALQSEGWFFAIMWWATLATLALGLLGCAHWLRRFLPIGVCYYFGMVHLAAATGMLRGLLGGQAVAWQRFPRTPVVPR